MLPTLYKQGKTKTIWIWSIFTIHHFIIIKHGQLDGTIQISKKEIIEGKNIGKKNETSSADQAIKEALSLWKKQKRKNYFETIEEAKNPPVLPMLAHKFKEKKHKVLYPAIIQPKLDGVRCLSFWEDGEIFLMSRGNKRYHLPHIEKAVKSILPEDNHTYLDGEIYIHGETLQEINRRVKKYRPNLTEELEYHLYDFYDKENPEFVTHKRLNKLRHNDILKKVSSIPVQTEEDVYKWQEYFIKEGYEGAIVRNLKAIYEPGHRSNDLLKVKSFDDDEYRIIGAESGTGKYEDCVTWTCITPEGKPFNCTPKGTIPQKRKWFKESEKYIGSWLKVQYFGFTENMIPNLPVGLTIKLEEDMS